MPNACLWKPFTIQYYLLHVCRCIEAENTQVGVIFFFIQGNSVPSKCNVLKFLISHGANMGITILQLTIGPLSTQFLDSG